MLTTGRQVRKRPINPDGNLSAFIFSAINGSYGIVKSKYHVVFVIFSKGSIFN